ncbi:TRAP transporter small permease [Balneolaceae bacterium ANBcel3]|nr:TRAP transporter small permease [Balneolaceae bacterium ANBcel3]
MLRKRIDQYTRLALLIIMSLLVLDVVWQVFTRYILQSPSTFTDELARFLLIWVSLLGGAYYSGKNIHISVEVLPSRLSPQNRKKLQIFIKALVCVFVFSVFVIGGIYLMYTIRHQITPALQIPMALVYLIGPVSGSLICFYQLDDIRLILSGKDPQDVEAAPEVTS